MSGSFFSQLFTSIAEGGRALLDGHVWRAGGARASVAAVTELCQALVSQRGEASGAALAIETLAAYSTLDADDRAVLFERLLDDFAPESEAVLQAAEAYRGDPSQANLLALGDTIESPRQELFRRLNMAPGGTAALVELRHGLLRQMVDRPELRVVDADLLHLFRSWFNRGFLLLQRIDWRTPAVILEKLIRYEAVHAIDGWDDLRRRVAADRRCFAFFHPALPDEPLIFVQVALIKGMADKVQPLLDRAEIGDPASADTALFYSISDCQAGLRGISFGNFLIKQVAAELQAEWPNLKTFATLSPIPGFTAWLHEMAPSLDTVPGGADVLAWLQRTADDDAEPPEPALQQPLLELCAHYLGRAKRKGRPRDPVARFHLRNGARLEQIDWAGDLSARGVAQSAGLMVNYLYQLDQVERNHEAYVNEGRIVTSRKVEGLIRAVPWPELSGA